MATVVHILERMEYLGHTVNFKTYRKSYKNKKLYENPKEEWLIIENTHEPIISQHDFDLVQEIRSHKRRRQKSGTVSPFAGMVYCADCGNTLYVGRAQSMSPNQEHMMCSTYAHDSDECTAHYIRTCDLTEIRGGSPLTSGCMVWGFCPHAIPSWLGFPTPCGAWSAFHTLCRMELELCDYISMSV